MAQPPDLAPDAAPASSQAGVSDAVFLRKIPDKVQLWVGLKATPRGFVNIRVGRLGWGGSCRDHALNEMLLFCAFTE